MPKTIWERLGIAWIYAKAAHFAAVPAMLLGALLLATLGTPAGAVNPAVAVTSASSQSPLMFGASGSTRELVESHERILGEKLQGLRVYKQWDSTLFTSSQIWARDSGHTIFLSISSPNNGASWADIASAQPGSGLYADMQRQAREIKAFGDKVYIAFTHEPETEDSYGSPAQFAAAWRKVISTYRAAGVTNAKYVLTLTAWGFSRNDSKNSDNYYPGDDYVDYIAADGYNWYRCRDAQWRELSSIIEAHRRFGLQHPSKGLMLWEFGSVEDPARPGRKAEWFRDAQALLKQPAYDQYAAVITWEGRLHDGNNRCGFDYTSTPSARDAWVAMAKDPFYGATTVG